MENETKSLRQLLQTTVEDKEIIIEEDGYRFVVRGSNDASVITQIVLQDESFKYKQAKLFSMHAKKEVSKELVTQIAVVKACLVPEAGQLPYDDKELLKFALEHGWLFLKVLEAAFQVLDLNKANKEAEGDIVGEQAIANFPDGE